MQGELDQWLARCMRMYSTPLKSASQLEIWCLSSEDSGDARGKLFRSAARDDLGPGPRECPLHLLANAITTADLLPYVC